MFDIDMIRYAMAKQLGTAHTIETSYGAIPLDDELAAALEKTLRPILERRLNETEQGEARHG